MSWARVVGLAVVGVWILLRLPSLLDAPALGAELVQNSANYLPAVLRQPAPTPTATPCNTSVGVLTNGSFEDGLNHWLTSGSPQVSTAHARDGSRSVRLAGRNSAEDVVLQGAAMPSWAESGAMYVSVFMESEDSTLYPPHDALTAIVYDGQMQPVASAAVYNTSPRGVWHDIQIPIANATAYRNKPLLVSVGGYTDSAAPSTWYLDKADLRFGCGATLAGGQDEVSAVATEPAPQELVAWMTARIEALRASGELQFGAN